MSEKMDKIDQEDLYMQGLLGSDSGLTFPERQGPRQYVYNSEKAVWEAREILEKINKKIKSYE